MPPPALVGRLALGIGFVFIRPRAAQFHDRTDDGVWPPPVERHAQLEQHVYLAQRVRLDRALDLAFGLELTC